MSSAGAGLLGLAVLVAASQWLWTQVVAHVDLLLIPTGTRQRVERLQSSSPLIYLASGAVVAGVVCIEGAALLV